jgi:hypothetical protein
LVAVAVNVLVGVLVLV